MFVRPCGALAVALLLSAGLTACSSKTYRDINYGSDVGRGFVPEVVDAAVDGDAAQGSGGAAGTGGASGSGGSTGTDDGAADAGVGDAADDAGGDGPAEALDNG